MSECSCCIHKEVCQYKEIAEKMPKLEIPTIFTVRIICSEYRTDLFSENKPQVPIPNFNLGNTQAKAEDGLEWITYSEAAKLINRHKSTICGTVNTYKLPKKSINGKVFIEKHAVLEHFKKHKRDDIHTARLNNNRVSSAEHTTNFIEWKHKITKYIVDHNQNVSKVLSEAYKIMKNKYGIVFEQLNKEYYAKFKHGAYATINLCYFAEVNNKAEKDLLYSIVVNILEGHYK